MAKYKLKDIIIRANTKVDKDTTNLIYYVGGEHFTSGDVVVDQRGLIEGSTIGPMFYYGFKAGQFLLVSRNPHLKKAGVVDFDGICSEKTFVLETADPSVLSPRFLPFVLQNDRFWEYAVANRHGSTNFFINWATLSAYEFDLPSIEEQEKLADILWALVATKKKYEKLMQKTDELVKSQFIEMFGNPILHEKDDSLSRLGDICLLKAGKFVKADDIKETQADGMYPCYGGNGLRGYVPDYNQEGDYPLIGRQGALCGNVQYATGRFHATEHAVVVTPKIEMNRYWLYHLLVMLELNRYASGAAQPGLAVNKLEDIRISVPHFADQNLFSALAEQSDKSKFELTQAISRIDDMIKALMQG